PSPLKSPTPATCQRSDRLETDWVMDPLADFQMTFCPVAPLRHSTSACPAIASAGTHAKASVRVERMGMNARMSEPPQGRERSDATSGIRPRELCFREGRARQAHAGAEARA